ncbi:Uncharacterised protein [Sphingobacterium thalpophilum]|uniref:Uncharacterized protein n=2 Tax=Bacteroidota TaxID=976 RepID=A0A4U9VKI5_9SPHI|nr:MAG: hypothetical protein BGO31_19885 [Bacteroidetes bacterium 43-16]VTR46089.1 Uncharacterised protein [Sphingobacterium thalpophilum]
MLKIALLFKYIENMLSRILFVLLLNPLLLFSQTKAGGNCIESIKLYTSFKNYENNQANDSICLSGKSKKFSIFYNKLVLKDGQNKRKYAHGSLWGYQKGNDLFRYFDKTTTFGTYGYHKIIDTAGLIIYSKKESGGYRMSSTYKLYFYSKDLNSPLKKLTIKNLEADFPNPEFIAELKKLKKLSVTQADSNLKINDIYNKFYKH